MTGEVYDLVQCERRRRQESGTRICSGHVFASRIYCGECGGLYGSKVWGSNTKYRRMVWQCNNKYRAKTRCSTPHLSDEQVQTAFTAMVNGMLESKEHILAFYDELIEQLTDVTPLKKEKECLERDGSVIEGEMKAWIAENARRAMSQLEYYKRYDELEARLNEVNAKQGKVDETILLRNAKRGNALQVMAMIRQDGLASEFDEGLFGAIVERVTVYKDKLVFRLKDGTEREVMAR